MEMNIVYQLMLHALNCPQKNAFIYLTDGSNATCIVTFEELMLRVKQLATHLSGENLLGKRVMLIYQDTIEFIVAFMACQYAGIVAVPVFFNRSSKLRERLTNIIKDAEISAILTVAELSVLLQQTIDTDIEFVLTTNLPEQETDSLLSAPLYHPISFIQYTSGSTGVPKGVVISSNNLLHNQEVIRNTFGCDENSVIMSWLPFHHDMGLIGNILHAIYVGCTCVLMSPLHFMQRPVNWLKAISNYKVTHSGGPNFAFDLCVDKVAPHELSALDLSSWILAYNGSEPVKADTIARFTHYFASTGFTEQAFYPCYGLAEATLMVSGLKDNATPHVVYADKIALQQGRLQLLENGSAAAKSLVSSGRICAGMDVKIIAAQTQQAVTEMEEGEICIAGDSVTAGYWRKDNSNTFYTIDDRLYLRTGDIGFLYGNELFVNGRQKEMLIIRGVNYYPYDIEQLVADSHPAIATNGMAVFSIDEDDARIVAVAEINRIAVKGLDAGQVINMIDTAVMSVFGIALYDIILTTPLGIPRTTSGKLQRVRCREHYLQDRFNVIGAKTRMEKDARVDIDVGMLLNETLRNGDYDVIRNYLTGVIISRTNLQLTGAPDENAGLAEMGLDSLRAMDLINTVNRDLNINIDATQIFQHCTFSELIVMIESMLWLKKEHNREKGIVL